MRKCRIGTAKFFTLLLLLYHTSVKAAGFQHGAYEGEELQLPAVFVMDSACTITYAHYGKDISDIPSPAQLAELLQ